MYLGGTKVEVNFSWNPIRFWRCDLRTHASFSEIVDNGKVVNRSLWDKKRKKERKRSKGEF